MFVTVLRHGITRANLEKRYAGRTDVPLCPEGVAALRARKADLSVKTVYVSPLERAAQTARLLFPEARLICADGLREMDFGAFEMRSAAEMAGDAAYRAWVDGGCEGACPGGECRAAFRERACRAFDALVRGAIARGEPTLTIVAHGGTVMSVMSRYARPPRPYFDWAVSNGGGYRAALNGAAWDADPALTDYFPV